MPKSSIGQTPTEPKKKLEKVVKGKVAVKEQSDMQKIASQFLAEDLKTVKDRILTDYLLPMLKNGAWSILNSAFSIALWGEDRSRGGSNNYYGNNRGQRNSYQDHSACCSKAGGGDAVCRYPACGGKAAETGRRSIPAWKMKGRMIFEFGSVLHFEKWKRKALGAFQGARVLLP